MEEEDFLDLVLKILGNTTRRSMLELFSERPRFLSDISKELQIGQQAILRHIDEFIKAGILEVAVDEEVDSEKKIGRRPKFYKIAENKRIIIDITPERFDVDLIPSFLDETEELKEVRNIKFCADLEQIENEIDSLEEIKDPDARYDKIKNIENRLKEEINSLIDAKHFAEILLDKLSPKRKIVEDYLGISQ
ncbi:MAG: ArsR/SmtB family transcription factor [Promethearchaeota archaeon]